MLLEFHGDIYTPQTLDFSMFFGPRNQDSNQEDNQELYQAVYQARARARARA